MQAVNYFFRARAGERGDPVIGLHAAKGRVVSGAANRIDGKVLVLDLGFLQAHHIGFVLGEPAEDDREAAPDGVDVVGGDFHRDGRLGMLDYPACSRRSRRKGAPSNCLDRSRPLAARRVADMQEAVEAGRFRPPSRGQAVLSGLWRTGADLQVLWKKDEGGQGVKEPGIKSGCKGRATRLELAGLRLSTNCPATVGRFVDAVGRFIMGGGAITTLTLWDRGVGFRLHLYRRSDWFGAEHQRAPSEAEGARQEHQSLASSCCYACPLLDTLTGVFHEAFRDSRQKLVGFLFFGLGLTEKFGDL